MNPEEIKQSRVKQGKSVIDNLRQNARFTPPTLEGPKITPASFGPEGFTPAKFEAARFVPSTFETPKFVQPIPKVTPLPVARIEGPMPKPLDKNLARFLPETKTPEIAKTPTIAKSPTLNIFGQVGSVIGERTKTVLSELEPSEESKIIVEKYNPYMPGSKTNKAINEIISGKESKEVISKLAKEAEPDLKKFTKDFINFTFTALDAPNRILIRPAWDALKTKIAKDRGKTVAEAEILAGRQTISLPEILDIDPNSLDYQAYRFLDFAPELINVPIPKAGKLQTLTREIKVQPGTFDDIAEDAAKKFTQETGEALSREVVDRAKQIAKDIGNIKNIAKPTELTGQFNPSKYVKQQVTKQKEARIAGKPTIMQKIKQIANEIDIKFQDFTTPINQAVNKAIKEGKKLSPEQNPIFQIDRVLRSSSIASQRVKDEGLANIIQKVDNIDEFNQYLIAKSTIELKSLKEKIKTGRNIELDKKLVASLDSKYKTYADKIFDYNKNLLNQVRASGLISGDLYNQLIKRKEYVPLNRIFSEVEEILESTSPRAVASLAKQSIVKKLEGSEREIINPLESILTNTYKATAQIERNIAARQIANLVKDRKIPGKILDKGEKFNSNEVISYLDNGEKKNVFVGRELARAAKYLNKENTNILTNILQVPTRVLQVGAVGLNAPFVISNLVRDQITAAIVSGKPIKNTILNPVNFVKTLFEVYGEKGVYDDFIRAGAGYSSLDITRDTAESVRQLRAARSPIAQFSDAIRNPGEMFKALENFISKAETATRLQVFKTAREDALKKGLSPGNAEILAADAARNVTANFARRGEFGTVLNAVIPFFNATIQGSRTLRNAFVKNPVRTTALFASTVALPVTATTLWNISDPERKKIYDQIPEFEKERNLIVIPPVITYDDRGYPFVFRMPKPQGFNQLADPVRKLLEQSYESIPDATLSLTNNLLSATTGFTLPTTEEGGRQLVSQFTPQLLKPPIELATGVNLFTGQRIIPMGLEKLPPQEQVKETTSLTARNIGNTLGVSPLIVENTIKTSAAGLGEQLLNITDRIQAGLSQGAIPSEQIGGRDPFESIINVFYRATGGADVSRIYDDLKEIDQEKALLNLKVKDMILKNDIEGIKSIAPELTSQQFKALERSVSEKEFAKTLSPQNKALFNLSSSQLEELKSRRPELNTTIDEISTLQDSLKEKTKIDTYNFNFKSTGFKLPKIKNISYKYAKTRVKKAPKAPKIKIAKIKKRKPIQIKLAKRKTTRV